MQTAIFELLQDYRDLVASVNVVREVIELAFGVTLPSADAVSFLRQLPVWGLCVKELSLLA
jgi:hypothetical protein